MGPPPPRAHHMGASGVGDSSKLVCCPSARGQQARGTTVGGSFTFQTLLEEAFLGQTLLEEFERNAEHGHLMAAAEDGCQQPPQHVQGLHTPTTDQEDPKKARLGQSMRRCQTQPAKWLCPVTQVAGACPSGHHSHPAMGGRAVDGQEPSDTSVPVDCICLQPNCPPSAEAEAPEEHQQALQQSSDTSLCIGDQTPLCREPASWSLTPCEAGPRVFKSQTPLFGFVWIRF